jgi:hypothetical protein
MDEILIEMRSFFAPIGASFSDQHTRGRAGMLAGFAVACVVLGGVRCSIYSMFDAEEMRAVSYA